MENKLHVKNLKISFRTMNGKVQAVRGIDFDLMKGETLAIVGESGSGKSVTSKAILGILAGNSIIEGGEIIYDGKDLLKISEDDFHEIRGDKIAMIFQDPLSSLNPIVKIGRQLTEAMLLKNRTSRHSGRKDFNHKMRVLSKHVYVAKNADIKPEVKKEFDEKVAKFKSFVLKQLELEKHYNTAYEAAKLAVEQIELQLFLIEKNAVKDFTRTMSELLSNSKNSLDRFVVRPNTTELEALVATATEQAKLAKKDKNYALVSPALTKIKAILEEALGYDKPNFFGLGYYVTFVDENIPELPVSEMNSMTHNKLDEGFMLDFIAEAMLGVKHSYEETQKAKNDAIATLTSNSAVFNSSNLDKKTVLAAVKAMSSAVEKCIDYLSVKKDSPSYTFESSLRTGINRYFSAIKKNELETKRYAKDTKKHAAIIAKGKIPHWTPVAADITDLDSVRALILDTIQQLVEHYKALVVEPTPDYTERTVELIDFFKEKSSAMVYKVTPAMARAKAIKLMDEVGIPESHKRYNQYPFEFSGGMRQRIVIAIALAANPDILICDEPTTALDVTIQSQILELINDLKRERNLSVIFITHDLGVVANMADRIAVMYAGKIVEYGTAQDIFYAPAHPYTWALLSSMPDLDTNEKLEAIPGTPPNMIYPPKGDAFAERNKYAMKIDFEEQPPMFEISDTHFAATWLLHPEAPKVEPPRIVTERIERMKKRGGNIDA